MSYILDALKKLEHEKTKKSRGTGMVNISGSLFENDRPEPAGSGGWKIGVAVIAAVLMTFAVTWYFLPAVKGRAVSTQKPVTLATQTPAIVVAPAPVVPAVVAQNAPVPAPTAQYPASPLPVQPPPSKPHTTVQVTPALDDAATILTKQELHRRLKDRNTPSISMAAPADIKLSGIAYQDERRARRAVVNGFLLQEGAVISGATVTDIYQDRVRFSLGGRNFELSLAATGISAPGK